MTVCDLIEDFRNGDGLTTNFSFTFEYIKPSDVHVALYDYTDNLYKEGTAAYTLNGATISFTVAPPPAQNNIPNIKIFRVTGLKELPATFFPGSAIRAQDLNDNFETLQNAAQETECRLDDFGIEDINPADIITATEIDVPAPNNYPYDGWDDQHLATAGAIKKLAPVYSGVEPPPNIYEGKLWFKPGNPQILRVWSGSKWVTISSTNKNIAPFEPAEIIFVNTQGNDANDGRSRETAVRNIRRALEIANAAPDNPLPTVNVDTASYNNVSGEISFTTTTPHNLTAGNSVLLSPIQWTCTNGTKNYPSVARQFTVARVDTTTQFTIFVGVNDVVHTYVADQLPTPTVDPRDFRVGDGKIISVAAGVYDEVLPLVVKAKNLSIIGDSLRNTYVHPKILDADVAGYDPTAEATDNEVRTMFELDSGSYLANMTFAGLKARGPRGGNADDPGTYGLPTEQGWVAAFRQNAVYNKSPYIQNCTAFNDSSIDNLNFNPNYIQGEGGDVTSSPCGGGILANGNTPAASSPLRSFVVDSFTQISLDGPGILATNMAYAQLVSFFGTFCRYHAKARSGATLNLSNCTTDFGEYGLIADGKGPQIFTGRVETTVEAGTPGDQQEVVSIKDAVYSEGSLVITPDTFTTAVINVGTLVRIQQLRFERTGSQPKFIPTSFSKEYNIQNINQADGTFEITIGNTEIDPADGWAYVPDSGSLLVPTGGTNGPEPSTVITVNSFGDASAQWAPPRALVPGSTMLMEANGVLYPIVNATPTDATKSEFNIEVYSPLNAFNKANRGFVNKVAAGETVRFYLQSYISTGGHTMEFVGSGTDYRAHPDYGGVPVSTNEAVELGGEEAVDAPLLTSFNGGRVWLSSTDQNGTFKVGDSFQVNQQTGQIFIDPSFISQPPLSIVDNINVGPWSIYTEYGTDTNINLAPKGSGGLIIGGEVKTDGSGPVGPSTAPIIGPVKERSIINSEGEQRDFPVLTQEDIGYDADEVPVGGLLGELAFTNTPPSVGVAVTDPQPNEVKFYLNGTTLTIKAANPVGTIYSADITLTKEE